MCALNVPVVVKIYRRPDLFVFLPSVCLRGLQNNLQLPRVAAEAEATRVVTWLTDAVALFTSRCMFSSNGAHLYLEHIL